MTTVHEIITGPEGLAANGAAAIADVRELLNRLDTVTLTRQLLVETGTLLPLRLRNFDAIHLAAAQRARRFIACG